MNKVGIITNIDANHGSCIFNASICNLIQQLNPENDVHIIDYMNPRWRGIELLRSLKLNNKIPFYNLQRSITLSRFIRNEIPSESLISIRNYDHICEELGSRHYSTLITGKVVWDISYDSPTRFPNIYWFSEKIIAKKIAYAVSERSTCDRAFVGCVLVLDKRILTTGFNGSPAGQPHCDEEGHLMVDGHCIRTIHAETNAIIQAALHGVSTKGATCYVTHLPCINCTKALINAGIVRLVYGIAYRTDENAMNFLKAANIEINQNAFDPKVPVSAD